MLQKLISRSILLEHSISYPAISKKADLVSLFDNNVRSQASVSSLSCPMAVRSKLTICRDSSRSRGQKHPVKE